MAQIEETGSGNGRKSNVELNLVPFIDLMSVCIIFLLITAVWTQVSMIQLGSSIYSKKNSEEPFKPPLFSEVILRVDVQDKGFRVVLGKDTYPIPKRSDGSYNQEALIEVLKKAKERYPEKTDGVVSVADDVSYQHLVSAMDSLLMSEFPQVSITVTGVE